MRIASLHLRAYGPFDGAVLDFERPAAGLQIVYGPNERGKSTAMRAIEALLFGFGHSTPDAWDGNYGALRVGAVLDDGARRIGLMRRKGNQRTLFEFDPVSGTEQPDRPVEQSRVDAMTGGLDARRFLAMHWLDSEQLRVQGRELLNSGSDLGAALFSAASGVPRLRQVSAALDASARALFVPRGSVPTLNAALRELDESVRAERSAGVRPSEWKARRDALEQAIARTDRLEAALNEARVRRAHLERLLGLGPQVGRLEALQSQLRALVHVPALPEDAGERIAVWSAAIARAEVAGREAAAQLAQRREALDTLQVPQAWLDEAEAIARLAARLDEHESLRAALPGRASAAVAAAVELRRALGEVGGGECLPPEPAPGAQTQPMAPTEPMEEPDPVAAAIASGTRLAARAEALLPLRGALADARLQATARRRDEARVAGARDELALALRAADEARVALGEAGSLPDVAALIAAVDAVSAAGDLEPRIAALRAKQDVADVVLARQAAALGATDAAALARLAPMPLADVERAEALERDLRTELATLAARREEPATTLPRLEAERDVLAARGPILDREALDAARRERDGRLDAAFGAQDPAALRDALGVLGTAIRDADRIADLRFGDAARLADIESLSQRIGLVRGAVAALDAETARVSRAAAEAAASWEAGLAARGLPTMTPAAHREWSARHQRLLDALHARDELDAQLRAARIEAAGHVALLRSALESAGLAAPALDSPAALLAHARRQVDAVAEQVHRRRQRADVVARAEAECRRRQATLDDALAALAATQADWGALAGSLGLADDSTAERVESRLASVDALRDALAGWESALRAYREADERCALFRSDAAALAGRVGLEAPGDGDESVFVGRCRETLAQVARARDERLRLATELGQFEREAADAQRRGDEARESLDALRAQAGAEDLAALQRAVALDAQRRDTQRAAAELDTLVRATTGAARDRWVSEALAADAAVLQAEAEALDHTIAQQEAERDLALAERTRAREAFDAIDGGARAAAAAETSRERLAAVSRLALDYARLRIARELLDQAVQRHAQRAQGPMLAAAAHWFARLTAGRWIDLRPEWEGDRQVLQAVPAAGRHLAIERLSEGAADALYLALRLAAIDVRAGVAPPVPLLLDDVLMTFDDERATLALQGLAELGQRNQVVYFTHHSHLVDLAQRAVPAGHVAVTELLHRPVPA